MIKVSNMQNVSLYISEKKLIIYMKLKCQREDQQVYPECVSPSVMYDESV